MGGKCQVATADGGRWPLLSLFSGEEAPTFSQLLEQFESEWLPTRDYSARCLKEIGFKIARYEDHLSKTLTKARDDSKAYAGIPKAQRPTLHEIRALGAWLYEQQGYPLEYIQALSAHADVRMAEHCQARHEEDRVQYMRVSADLKV